MTIHHKKNTPRFWTTTIFSCVPEKVIQIASTFMQHDHTSPEIFSEHLPSSSTVIIPDMAVDDIDEEASTGLGGLILDNSDVELGSDQGLSDISERDINDESRALGMKIGEIPTEYPLN